MLRAARFAAQLGFTVDPNMIGKIRKMPETILTISRERWVGELDKLLCTNNVGAGMDVLVNTHLLRFMIPELALVAKDHVRIWEQIITDIQHCDDLDLKWAYLLEPIGKLFAETKISRIDTIIYKNSNLISAEIATGITKRLKFSNERSDKIADFFK
jgi:poly(A) polymerase